MSDLDEVKQLLERMSESERRLALAHLRSLLAPHPMETKLMVTVDGILDSLSRAGELTIRMIRGIFAESAWATEVLPALQKDGWRDIPTLGDPPYDFKLTQAPTSDDNLKRSDLVLLQVKMQRSEKGQPLPASAQLSVWPANHWVVEVQKTRSGKKDDKKTRPYGFGEFDILAVSLGPSEGRWSHFVYTLDRFLIPSAKDPGCIQTMQPVSPSESDTWTRSFTTAVGWMRSDVARRVDDTFRPARLANFRGPQR